MALRPISSRCRSNRRKTVCVACFNPISKLETVTADFAAFADCLKPRSSQPLIRPTCRILQTVSQRLRRNPRRNQMPIVSIKMPPPTRQGIPTRRLRHILHPPNSSTIPTVPRLSVTHTTIESNFATKPHPFGASRSIRRLGSSTPQPQTELKASFVDGTAGQDRQASMRANCVVFATIQEYDYLGAAYCKPLYDIGERGSEHCGRLRKSIVS